MDENLDLSTTLPASPQQVYSAWLSSQGHSLMTGSPAQVDPRPEGAFSAWDGYIWGTTLELDPPGRILQAWRTTEFPEDAPDSLVELTFAPAAGGTLLTLRHTRIPAGQGESYAQGWQDYYFIPMQAYFSDEK
jgi:activator of HSP90 ATPase